VDNSRCLLVQQSWNPEARAGYFLNSSLLKNQREPGAADYSGYSACRLLIQDVVGGHGEILQIAADCMCLACQSTQLDALE
jgi:hypothetical protein